MEQENKENIFTAEIFNLPHQYVVEPIITNIENKLREDLFDIVSVFIGKNEGCIVFNNGIFTYSILVEDYDDIQYGISGIKNVPFDRDTLYEYTQHEDFTYFYNFLDQVKKNHWNFIPEMYEDAKKLFDKYNNKFDNLGSIINEYF